jgi:hypothetical protein
MVPKALLAHCFHDFSFLKLILRQKWRVNHLKYFIINEITRLFCNFFFIFSKYLVLYFTLHFEKYVYYRNFEKYNAHVLLIYGYTSFAKFQDPSLILIRFSRVLKVGIFGNRDKYVLLCWQF